MDNGDWVFGDLIREPWGYCIQVVTGSGNGYSRKKYAITEETVCQYTGLKDKNGKRIFEGDICHNTRTEEIVSVKWHGTMAGYVWNKRRADCFLFDFGELFRACDKYEVIGNIHDNPELLERGTP